MVRLETGSSQGAVLVLNFSLDLTISKEAAQTVKREKCVCDSWGVSSTSSADGEALYWAQL